MAVEIERKFLVRGDEWRRRVVTTWQVIQGYLANTVRSSVRVRLAADREAARQGVHRHAMEEGAG